tara:strand:+ start:219 stop:641 length:423 start_codon:yes stop_codon:yes gene_type:complete
MKKYAWGPILKALDDREQGIQTALDQAEEARTQIAEATSKVEQILKEGKREKEELVRAAQETLLEYKKEQQAKIDKQIGSKLEAATEEIRQQKREAINELKNKVGELSIDIAEKILEKELTNKENHSAMITQSIKGLEIK